jgi:hypothetical protein
MVVGDDVTSIINYTQGNGRSYSSQTASSTDVTGLTATLSAGTFTNGSGILTFTITGTPSASGWANFDINIEGQSCRFTRRINELPSLRDTFQGGLVFYLDGNGGGLIAAPKISEGVRSWGSCVAGDLNGDNDSVVPELDGVGYGQANTTYIVNNCSDQRNAAKFCDDLTSNGYSDWFLPSKDELNLMRQNLAQPVGNVDNFNGGFYWSSSESDLGSAWSHFFFTGEQSLSGKAEVLRVRAVRAF